MTRVEVAVLCVGLLTVFTVILVAAGRADSRDRHPDLAPRDCPICGRCISEVEITALAEVGRHPCEHRTHTPAELDRWARAVVGSDADPQPGPHPLPPRVRVCFVCGDDGSDVPDDRSVVTHRKHTAAELAAWVERHRTTPST